VPGKGKGNNERKRKWARRNLDKKRGILAGALKLKPVLQI